MKPVIDYSALLKVQAEPTTSNTFQSHQPGQSVEVPIEGKSDKDIGVTLRPHNYDEIIRRSRFEKQSGSDVFGNMLVQTAGTITGMGISGIGALLEAPWAAVRKLAGYEIDMQNDITRFGDTIKEGSIEQFPIHSRSDDPFQWGSRRWWAKNVPNIASTIGILIPAAGSMKVLSMLGKSAQASKLGWVNTLGKPLKPLTSGNRIAETVYLAGTQRLIENFAEGAQVYNDIYDEALANLSDPTNFQKFINTKEGKELYDKAQREAVNPGDMAHKIAEYIASDSAVESFKVNSSNIIFDLYQSYMFTKAISKATIGGLRSNKVVGAAATSFAPTADKAAINAAAKAALGKQKYLANAMRPYVDFIGGASSEGVEEIINAIGQGEGMHYGKHLLGQAKDSTFKDRLNEYLADPATWEQGFWGAIGGATFQAAGTAKSLYNKAMGKPGNENEDYQMLDITTRKLTLATFASRLKNIERGVTEQGTPYEGTDVEIEAAKKADYERLMADIAVSVGKSANTHGTADTIDLTLDSSDFHKLMEDTLGEDPHIKASDAIADLKAQIKQVNKFYEHVYGKLGLKTNNKAAINLVAGEYANNKHLGQFHASKAEQHRSNVAKAKLDDIDYNRILNEGNVDIDVELNNAAIDKTIQLIRAQLVRELIEAGAIDKAGELLSSDTIGKDTVDAFMYPVIEALTKKKVEVAPDRKLSDKQWETISDDIISELVDSMYHETISEYLHKKADNTLVDKKIIKKAEERIDNAVKATKADVRNKFTNHIQSVTTFNEDSTIEEVNTAINKINEEKTKISKGDVAHWGGNKNMLTPDVVKDLMATADAKIKSLTELREAVRNKHSLEIERTNKNKAAVQSLSNTINDPTLQFDDTVTVAPTLTDTTVSQDVVNWVDTEIIPTLESARTDPRILASEINSLFTDINESIKQGAGKALYKYVANRILQDIYGYQSAPVTPQQQVNANAGVTAALANLQNAMSDPNAQQARFASTIVPDDLLKFDPKTATPRQVNASVKLFNEIAQALNKKIVPNKPIKLDFREVIEYMLTTYGKDFVADPGNYHMLQKGYLIISTSTDANFKTTSRRDVLIKYERTKAIDKLGHLGETEQTHEFTNARIIQTTGGEYAANIFLGDLQQSLVRNEEGHLVAPNKVIANKLRTIINDLQVGDTVTISVNTGHESYEENKDNKKRVPIKVTITKSSNQAVEFGYVNPSDEYESGGIVYILDESDYIDQILNSTDVQIALENILDPLFQWFHFAIHNPSINDTNAEEYTKLTQALIDADTTGVLDMLMNIHGEGNKIELASISPALLHLARVIFYEDSTATGQKSLPTIEEIKYHVQNWKHKLLRDKVNHNRIRDRIEANVNAIIETTVLHKTRGNIIRSIDPNTGETIYHRVTDTIGNKDEVELFILKKNTDNSLVNADSNKKGAFNAPAGKKYQHTLYTQIESAVKDVDGNPVMIEVALTSDTIDGAKLGKTTDRSKATVEYLYNKLHEYMTLRNEEQSAPAGNAKNAIYAKLDALQKEINEITPVINKKKDSSLLTLSYSNFAFTSKGDKIIVYFGAAGATLTINGKESNNFEADLKKYLGGLSTNVVYENFEYSTYKDPITGKETTYKDFLLDNNIVITDVGMLLDHNGEKISNVTISNDNNRGGRPLMVNIDTSKLADKPISTKKELLAFVKKHGLNTKYNKFYGLIGDAINDGELTVIENSENNNFAQYNSETKTLTIGKKWRTLNTTAKSFILIHEFVHKVLKKDPNLDMKVQKELNDFRKSVVASSEFKSIDYAANEAIIQVLTAKAETTPLTDEEEQQLRMANIENKVFVIFNNVYFDNNGKMRDGIGAIDNEELITYGLTDSDVAGFLNKIKSDKELKTGYTSMWQELKNIIKEFIAAVTGTTKLDELAAIVDSLLEGIDAFVDTTAGSPVEDKNMTAKDASDINEDKQDDTPGTIKDDDDANIELAIFASSEDNPTNLSHRFRVMHPDGTLKRYLEEKYDDTVAKARKINAQLTKEGSPYRAKVVNIAGERGDFRQYLGIVFRPINTHQYNQYAEFASNLDRTKPIGDLRQEFNDYVLDNPVEDINVNHPNVTIVPDINGNTIMGFVNVDNFIDANRNRATTNNTPVAFLGMREGNTFTLQLLHTEIPSNPDVLDISPIAKEYVDNWGKYTFTKITEFLVNNGITKINYPKFAFNEVENEAIAEHIMQLEDIGIKVNFTDTDYELDVSNKQQAQQAIFASEEYLDNYSKKFTAEEEPAVANLASYIYRKLKASRYKTITPASVKDIRYDIAKVIEVNQKKKTNNLTASQIALQNKVIEDLRSDDSDVWALTLRDLRGKYKHNPEDLENLLENADMENKWEDNAHLFNNPNETIGDHLKDFLSSIPLVDPDTISYSPTTNEITYKGTNSSLTGFVESADFRLMNMKLIELLKGKLNVTEMLDTLREYGMESTSSYGKAILILYSQLNDPANEAMRNAFFSYYHKRLTTRYANLFRNSGEALQHEQIIANKIDGKYVLADEWRNAILTNFDNDHFSLEWSLNWNKQYNEFVKGYKDYNGSILPIEYATQISDLYADLGIEIEPAVLQYYYKKTNDKSEFGRLFLTPMNRLKNVNSDPDNYGFIDKKINDPTLKFSEEGNLIRLGELVAYFTFGKGRFSTMNVKKNVVFTPANPHFISDFMDNINHKDDAHVLNYLSRYTNVAGSEHSYLLWGDQVDSLGKRIRGKEGIGFLNYKIELGQRIPVSINRKNIDGFTYAELDGINELNTNIPKEYTDLSDSEWDLLNLITFYNSEGKRPTRPDTVTIPMVIPSDGGVLGTFNVPKVKVTTEDNAAWFIIKEGYYSTNTNQAKFDSGAYFTEAYAEKFAPINDFINSPLVQAYLGAIRSEIEEIKTATKVIFEIDTTTGLPKRDDNGMPIVRKGVKGQLFYHYMKHDADGNPIYFDDKGMPTGRGFKSHLFGFKALDGSIKTLNDSTFVFSNGFISQYTNVNAKDVTARLLALIHNHLHEQYYIANETFKGYKNYVSRIINKNNQPILNNMPYEEAVAEMVFNHQLFNIEQQRLFMGRASDYKSNLDTTKRAKELIAPGVANALTGTFDAVTINDLKLISAVIDGKIEEAAVAFQSLYKSKYDANKIKRAATDSKYISKLNRYEKAILDVIAPYYDNDSANAVSLITLEEYEKRIHGWGLTNYYADLISKLHTGRPLTKDDYDKMVQLQKNYYYDYSYNEDLQKFIPVQVKNAEVILTPNLVAGLQLQSVADFMNEMGISQINLESAEKNGTIGIARIHDDEGNITSDFRDKLLANVRSYNYSSLRKQQDVPDHVLDAYNKLGVQIAKKIIDNIDNTQQYVVNGKNYDGEQLIDRYFDVYSKNIIESANDLLARIINEVVDVRDVINNREPITINQAALREILMEQAVNLGLSKNVILSLMTNINDEGNVPLYYNTFYKKWQSILTSLFSNNVINQKHPGPHLTQMSTMFLRPPVGNVSQFTQRNYVSKHKSRSSNRYDKSNIEWAQKIHDRKDYRLRAQRVEGGNMVKAEVLLPRTSSMFIQQGRKYSIDELMAIDPKILTMVGYRIPTEDKHSMIVFEVVGFLPDETAAIVLPDDFVTQSGADFDIDSLYLMVYNIERTKDNSLRIVDNTTKDENLLYNRYFKNIFKSSAAKQLIHEMSLPYDELIGTIFQDDVVFERTAKIPIKELKKRFVDAGILMTDAEFSNLSLTEKQKLGETRQGRENEILDIYVSILMHPAHTVERNSPNGHPDIDVAKHMLEEITGRSMEDIDPSTYFGQREFRSRNISGRTLKAFSVSRDSLLSIFQRTGAYVDLEGAPLQMTVKVDPKDQLRTKAHFTRLYPGTTFTTAKEGDETVTYAVIPMEYLGRNGATGFVNIDNKQITSYSAQFTANILDGVKDQLPRNVNEKTLGWMETLINMGFLYTDVIAFYNLPIFETVLDGLEVKDNALKYKKYKKESTVTADVFTQIYRTANKEGLKIYRSTPNGDYDIINTLNNKSVIYPKPSEIDQLLEFYGMSARVMPSLEVMKNDIANRPTDFDATLRNLQYLSVHSTISYITTSIKAVTRPLTVDKLGAGPTFEKTKDIIEKINVRSDNRDVIKVGDKPILNAIFDDYETSAYKPLYTYYNYGNKLAYDILAPLFITELPSYNSVANRLLSVVKDSSVNPKRLEQVVSYMNKQLLNTIPTFSTSDEDIKRIIGYGKVRGTSFRFTQPNAIAAFDKLSLSKKIELMRKRYAKEGIDTSMHIINYFTLETNSAQFDRNKFERVTYIDNDIEDVLIGSFTKLWLSDDVFERSLARDLVKYAYHVNNLSYSYDNIARIIPSAILAYEDNGGSELHSNKGLSVSSKLREAFDLLSGGENGTDNTSIYFGNDNLVEVFILSNYKDDNFVYNANRAIIYDGDNMLNAFTTHPEGFISIPKGTAESFGDAITLAYIKTQDKDGEWHVYKRADLKEGDKYFYYYPVNKLEPFDRSTTSLVPVNNEMLPMNKVDQMLDAHRATVVKTTADIANGINISSTSTNELGKALSNVHYGRNMQSEYDIDPTVGAYGVSYPVNPVTNKPWISPRDRKVTPTEFPSYYKNRSKDNIVSAETVWGKSVEAWYKANTNVDMSLQDKMEVMKALIHIKLLTYPNLYNDIKANGGIDWLDKCSHFVGSNTTTGNWQGSGTDSNFIMALMDAYDLIDTSTVEIQATPIKARFDNTLGNETNTKPGGQLDLFNQEAQFASFTNQDLIDAMTESGDLEIVCSGGAKAQNGMFIGSKLYGDWEVVTDLKGFPKHSAGGVDISVDTDGKIAIAANGATILAADGMFIPNEQPDKPEYEAMSKVLSKRHKHLNWVQRGLSPDNYPSISNPDGTVSTHKLSYVTGENGEAYVYPTIIQQEDGTLKEMDGKSAWEYAKRTNTAMMVPNVELAEYYSKNGLVNHRPTVKSNKTNVNLLKSLNK